jgi:O-acetyl-ADP-ribose deacetylase (regulator of RNase III)
MIHYIAGDATQPQADHWVIAHICNNIGAFGRGFAKELGNRYPVVKSSYLEMHRDFYFRLGQCQVVQVGRSKYVFNMIAQDGLPSRYNPNPLSLTALTECLAELNNFCKEIPHLNVHMPKIGTGLARGSWDQIEPIIEECITSVDVFVYELV